MSIPRLGALLAIVFAAALSRLIPHPPNMTSITAVALFGGAYFRDRRLAFLVPLAAVFASDLVLGLYRHMSLVYLSFTLIVCIGLSLRNTRSATRVAGAALLSSVLFFMVTNFGVWALDSLYARSIEGLVACYVAAIPFFRNMLAGDLLYTGVMFGSWTLLERAFTGLRERPAIA
jgi:hypothetical protein